MLQGQLTMGRTVLNSVDGHSKIPSWHSASGKKLLMAMPIQVSSIWRDFPYSGHVLAPDKSRRKKIAL